jgi:hypothetical protein
MDILSIRPRRRELPIGMKRFARKRALRQKLADVLTVGIPATGCGLYVVAWAAVALFWVAVSVAAVIVGMHYAIKYW